MRYNTDKCVDPYVYMSLSAIYNEKLASRAKIVRAVVKKAMPVLKTLLKLPENVRVRIAPIKAKTINGRYFNGDNLCEIDCRLDWDRALVVLCHEMVHAEQYYTGRLAHVVDRRKGLVHTWHGSVETSRGSTYRAYRELPWEAEAFARQNELADTVNRILEST